ncbi:homeobox protein ATH1-like [Humulus lupulus]|uniref:homeobox protein ATH1-like n=1 Tax=Humulus lupulus TaxID=3486 RepID=UPI002B40D43F|nr:homeobox protein ATH1-like [Humulus lupulus]
MENNQTFKSLLTDGISPLNYTAMNNSFVLQSSLFDHHYHGDDLSYYNPLIDSYKRSFTRDEVSLLGGVGTELQEETANFMAAKAAGHGHGHGVQESLDDLAISVPHHMYSPCFVSNQDNSSYVSFENQYWGDIELDHLSGKTSEFHQTFDESVWTNNNNNNNLFLSLATSQPSVTTGLGQCSDMSGSVAEPNSGNTEKIMLVSEQNSCHNSKVISGSKYLSAAQQILAHVAGFSLGKLDHDHHYCSSSMNSCSFSTMSTMDSTSDGGFRLQGETTLFESHQQLTDERKTDKLLLLSLLQMVDDRYNKCLEEIHSVVSDPHIHARFALQTISVLYKGLRERIKHCLAMEATVSFDHRVKEKGFETSFIQKQWDLRQKKKQERLWIPQRGLPLKSVSVLKAWLFENFLHPYPKDDEKHWLAIKSGLTKIQVSNWFMNARGRLWKPMILEMEAELNKIKKSNKNKRISINHKINQIRETINLD